MIVVSDSTPLITLMKASRLDILQRLFGEVLVPEAVYKELTTNDSFADEADTIRNSDFIKKVVIHDSNKIDYFQRITGLDRGESEAIIYADENNVNLLLMDEAAGRKVAQNMSIPLTGSIGILIRAFQSGLTGTVPLWGRSPVTPKQVQVYRKADPPVTIQQANIPAMIPPIYTLPVFR